MKKAEIVVAGHMCLDISPEFGLQEAQKVETLFRPGRLINIDGVTVSGGGPVTNTGFAMARLGIAVQTMAGIGNDEFGRLLASIAQAETGALPALRDGLRTSYSVILAPPGIDRIILHDPAGNNEFLADDIDYDAVAQAGYFHFGYPPLMRSMYTDGGSELVLVYKQAKQVGAVTSLDMSLPDPGSESGRVDWASVLSKVLPYVDVFVPSIEEIMFMLDRSEYDRIMAVSTGDDFTRHLRFDTVRALGQTILSLGSAIALIKCGSNGIYIKTTDETRMDAIGKPDWADIELFQPTYYVDNFKSALAGGDTTVAGFLSGLIRDYNLYDCARLACRTGALCCTTYDSLSGLKPLDEIYALIQAGPAQNQTNLPAGAFTYNDKEKIYLP